MITHNRDAFARAAAIAKRDQLYPLPCRRQDTGDLIWLVQSRNDPNRYYLLTTSGEHIHCACPQGQHHGICAHTAAVHLALQAETQPQKPSTAPQASHQNSRSSSRQEQERQRRAEAQRRERALLWTDDRPFSIWK